MTMKARVLLAAIVLILTLASAGCGHYTCGATFGASSCSQSGGGFNNGGNGQPVGDAYVYVADPGGIQGFTLQQSKNTLVQNCTPSTCPAGIPNVPVGTPEWSVIAQKKILYVEYSPSANATSYIYTWTIAPDGSLADGSSTVFPFNLPFQTTGGAQAMIQNPAGTLLFMIDATAGNAQIHVYQIGSSGGLSEIGIGTPLPSGFEPYNLAIDGLGKYLYVSNLSGSDTTQIMAYTITNGALSVVSGSPFSLGLTQMQGDSSGKFMIGTKSSVSQSDANIWVLNIGSSGALSLSGQIATAQPPVSVVVQPNAGGTLVYAFNLIGASIGGNVEGYTLNASTGALQVISGSPFSRGGDAGQFDQAGKFLFVRDMFSKNMSVFDVTADTTLSTTVGSQGWVSDPWAWSPTDPQ